MVPMVRYTLEFPRYFLINYRITTELNSVKSVDYRKISKHLSHREMYLRQWEDNSVSIYPSSKFITSKPFEQLNP